MRLDADEAGVLAFDRLLDRGRELLQAGRRDYLDRVIDPEAMSVLLFTSGTTSESKAVPLSHRNLCADMMATVAFIAIGPGDVFLSILPIHHTYECMCGFLGPLYCGATIAFCDGLRHIPRNLRESKCTFLVAVPLVLETMYKRIWSEAESTRPRRPAAQGARGQRRAAARRHRPAPSPVQADLRGPRARPAGLRLRARPRWRRTSPRAFATSGSSSCRATD